MVRYFHNMSLKGKTRFITPLTTATEQIKLLHPNINNCALLSLSFTWLSSSAAAALATAPQAARTGWLRSFTNPRK